MPAPLSKGNSEGAGEAAGRIASVVRAPIPYSAKDYLRDYGDTGIEVDYLRPVLTGVPYVVRGRIDRRDGRKLSVSCRCTDPDGVVAFRATGLFVVVDVSHFERAITSGGGQEPVAP